MEEEDKVYFHEVSFIDKEGQLRTSKIPVVQELARQLKGLNHLPDKFKRVHPDHQLVTPSFALPIPTINMAKLRLVAEPQHKVRAQELAKLASEIGRAHV